ncbi:uncharacterized protein LOC106163177 [Lingula anatina]|uniref:Uncharacterized protein LOC106163177 n=1 Tax=Lingula anatina TaxID=7574 RepID=A0A1S3ID34_LINAN|nr:uncharacterized protein LOC106163177 [Lingula anatina]|eukprot:XP_013396147.1 uncharacterized protein LOC106163177 [Lingula anatina]
MRWQRKPSLTQHLSNLEGESQQEIGISNLYRKDEDIEPYWDMREEFSIIEAHKPLVPMFNKAQAKLPPRTEKLVMDLQDVDYEVVYEPGKNDADPDYLSRYPLPQMGGHSTEKMIRWMVKSENAVILGEIAEKTLTDPTLIKLGGRIHSLYVTMF